MKTKNIVFNLLLLSLCSPYATVSLEAQRAVSVPTASCSAVMPPLRPTVGDATHPDIGQGERKISARHVKWHDPRGFDRDCDVIYDKETRQIVASTAQGKVRFVHGKFLSFRGGPNAIDLVEAQPMAAAESDDKIFVEFAQRNVEWNAGKLVNRVKVPESKDEMITMAGVPFLQNVEPRSEHGKLIVKYGASGRHSGEVILDNDLKLASSPIIDSGYE
jgi:hypothetical protein